METSVEPGHDFETIRNSIVRKFLTANGEFISGEMLSQQLGVTRTAIWKHINVLESLGFQFESTHRRGYQLVHIPDILLEPLVKPHLSSEISLGDNILYFPEVDSTNLIAQKMIHNGAKHGTIVCAGAQTGGKGRRGRAWFAPQGGLWMSIIARHPFPLARAAELTLLASVGIRRAIYQQTGIEVQIKWPNDLLLNGKKICGILAEIRADGENVHHAVIGIGINTNIPYAMYPSELTELATSILIESGDRVANVLLTGKILNELDPLFSGLVLGESGFKDVHEEWKQGCSTIGQRIKIQTARELLTGVAVDVDVSGILYLRKDNGMTIRIHSGDILFR